jgi:hypothetical protein
MWDNVIYVNPCFSNVSGIKNQFMCFMHLNLLFITVNILAPTNEISFFTTSCNCSYQHARLFNEFDDKFGKLNKDC